MSARRLRVRPPLVPPNGVFVYRILYCTVYAERGVQLPYTSPILLSQIRIVAITRGCNPLAFGLRRFESCIWHRYVATPSNLVVGLEVFTMARFLGGLGSGLQNQIVAVQVRSELPKYIYYPLRRVYFFV